VVVPVAVEVPAVVPVDRAVVRVAAVLAVAVPVVREVDLAAPVVVLVLLVVHHGLGRSFLLSSRRLSSSPTTRKSKSLIFRRMSMPDWRRS
jgi:hypothetical protein